MAIPAVCHWIVRQSCSWNVKQPGSLGRMGTLENTTMSLDVDSRVHRLSICTLPSVAWGMKAVCSVKGVDWSGSQQQSIATMMKQRVASSLDDLMVRIIRTSMSLALLHMPYTRTLSSNRQRQHAPQPPVARVPAAIRPRVTCSKRPPCSCICMRRVRHSQIGGHSNGGAALLVRPLSPTAGVLWCEYVSPARHHQGRFGEAGDAQIVQCLGVEHERSCGGETCREKYSIEHGRRRLKEAIPGR